MVQYLLQATEMLEDKPTDNPINNKKIINKFKVRIKSLFDKWWKAQAIVTGQNKLDFYYKLKRSFNYESYLDNVPRSTRI